MKRVFSFEFKANQKQQMILRCLTYATSKLWNVGNYERKNWTKESGDPYPDWYRQKKVLKDHFWYKALPSQSAQEVLKQLHESWKSFYTLKRMGSIENPKPPRFKHQPFNIRFLNHGFRMQDQVLRLSLYPNP
jgi:putative transposase